MKHSGHVLRPAILQPPQAQKCDKVRKTFGHNTLESCKAKEKTKNKVRKPPMAGLASILHLSFSRLCGPYVQSQGLPDFCSVAEAAARLGKHPGSKQPLVTLLKLFLGTSYVVSPKL